jgi:hypothetical protein
VRRPPPSDSWPRAIRQRVREFVTAATGGRWPGMEAQATRLLESLPEELVLAPERSSSPAPAPTGRVDKSALPFAPPSFPGKADRKAGRNDRMREIRITVMRRARGRCEFLCVDRGEPTEAHHLFGGADRRALESEYTVAAICEECHDKCDASPAWARQQGLAFATRLAAAAQAAGDAEAVAGFTATVEELEGRIALARAQAPEPGDG